MTSRTSITINKVPLILACSRFNCGAGAAKAFDTTHPTTVIFLRYEFLQYFKTNQDAIPGNAAPRHGRHSQQYFRAIGQVVSHSNHSIGRIKSDKDKIGKYVYAPSFFKSSSYHEHISHYRTITMGLEALLPGNTLRAKATAVAAFTKCLKGEEVDEEYVRKCIEADESGKAFVCVMDKFGMHLAFSEGKKGKMLARNMAMQYYWQAKIWLLDHFPQHRAALESRLLKMAKTFDNFCLKRDGGGFVSKAAPYRQGSQRIQTQAEVKLQNLSSFDSQTLQSIEGVQRILLATRYKLKTEIFNISKKVLDVLTACVLRYYPLLKNLTPESPAIKRVETCVIHGGCSVADLLAWSTHLAEAPVSCENSTQHDTQPYNPDQKPSEPSYEQKVIDHQAAVIKHLIENSKLQNARMDQLEARMNGDSAPSARAQKQRRSKSKLLVTYMKLFIADGFILDSAAADYRDRVLELGKRAEDAILTYLKIEHGIKSRGSSAILKHLQRLHNAGALDALIVHHQRLLPTAAFQDPSPGYTQDVLDAVSK
ncbi:unnamed protein product [Phytophthora fragariaefolia]|uniref:Unnamed protein product n=1 Tax=Phytophthora fragariaefolia TaxID=1490495 RepID=A0A9W6XW26_9STRA|nr:unnamed protein product [Phytophthora fragariaefolia]